MKIEPFKLCETRLELSTCYLCNRRATSIRVVRCQNTDFALATCNRHASDREAQHRHAEKSIKADTAQRLVLPAGMTLQEAVDAGCITVRRLAPQMGYRVWPKQSAMTKELHRAVTLLSRSRGEAQMICRWIQSALAKGNGDEIEVIHRQWVNSWKTRTRSARVRAARGR